MDKWALFLANEKLHPGRMVEEDVLQLLLLCQELSARGGPEVRPHAAKLASRRQVVDVAIELGIDLPAMRHKSRGKTLIGRGLLDVWLVAYTAKFGSTVGTHAEWEARRRSVKTRLARP